MYMSVNMMSAKISACDNSQPLKDMTMVSEGYDNNIEVKDTTRD